MSELPAAATTALRATLTAADPRPGRVLAVFPSAVYVGLDEPARGEPAVLAVVTADGVRLPNALVIAVPAATRPLATVHPGRPARVGRGAVHLPSLRVSAARWWEPRPVLGSWSAGADHDRGGHHPHRAPGACPADGADHDLRGPCAHQPEESRGAVGVLAAALAASPSAVAHRLGPLAVALADDDREAAAVAAAGLLGLGPGLTPAGDDVLAGALATLALLGPPPASAPRSAAPTGPEPAGPRPTLPPAADGVRRVRRSGSAGGGAATGAWAGLDRAVGELAAARTTALSAALLHCARRGQVAAPAADLLRALTGDGDVVGAAARLVRVGHSSGRDLAAGILLAAQTRAARPSHAGAVA